LQAGRFDFGLAKLAESVPRKATQGSEERVPSADQDMPTGSVDTGQLTRPDAMMGTAVYISPEQIGGEEVDARTDLFSFGLVPYEMATGRKAFSGNTTALIFQAILADEPRPPLK
jgi:serine/threonine protein kinase